MTAGPPVEVRDTRTAPPTGALPIVGQGEQLHGSHAVPRRRGPAAWAAAVRRQWSRSLQLRTSVLIGVLTLTAAGLLSLFFTQQISEALIGTRYQQLQADANLSLQRVQSTFAGSAAPEAGRMDAVVAQTLRSLESDSVTQERLFLFEPLPETESTTLGTASSPRLDAGAIPADLAAAVASGNGVYYAAVALREGESVVPGVAFGTQVVVPPGSAYALYLVYDLSDVQESLDSVLRVLLLFGLGFVALNIIVAYLVLRLVIQSVQQAALAAETLSNGNLQVRLPVHGEDEVARLSSSFNRMADHIEDQITQLAQLSQMQQRFVSDVSHELRTPLTTVRMAADVLYGSRDDFDPVNRRSTELLYHQVDRFQAMLADLLEITRFDAGAAQLALEETDLFELVTDVILTAEPLAVRAGVPVYVVPQGEGFLARVDPRRIERIIRNLVNNAIEHAEGRTVDVVLGGDESVVSIAVVDQGIGMSAEQVEHVFDRFWRADPSRKRTTGGSGLGLSIAAEDTRIHGGSLSVWGELGVGSCFLVTLPREQPPAGVPHTLETMVDHAALALPPVYDPDCRRLASDPDQVLTGADRPRGEAVAPGLPGSQDWGSDRVSEQALTARARHREETP